jgi:hypothetical protein
MVTALDERTQRLVERGFLIMRDCPRPYLN